MDQETKDAIKAAAAEGVTPVVEGLKTQVEGVSTKMAELEGKISAIESSPIANFGKNFIISDTVHRGYKLSEQGAAIRNKAAKSGLEVFANDEQFESYAKWCLTAVAALKGDMAAMMELQSKTVNSEATDGAGQILVPTEYQMDLIQLARDKAFALNECTVINMSREQMKLPKEASLVSATWTGEGSGGTPSNPTFDGVTLTAKKLFGLTDYISNELLNDSAVDIVSMLTEQFSYAINLELDNQVLNGTGDPVSGLLTADCGNSVIMGTGLSNISSVTADDFSKMIYQLAEEDAVNAKFVFNRLVQHYVRTLKDTYGQYVWQKPGEGKPATLWELPIFKSIKAPGTSTASKAMAVLGNFKKFYIGRRVGAMTLDVDPFGGFNIDSTRFRMITRWALGAARKSAFSRLVTAS